MKNTKILVLLSSLVISTGALAATGPVPQCTSGAVNIEIYNKDLASENCSSAEGAGKYCIYDTGLTGEHGLGDHTDIVCEDSNYDGLSSNTNESYSLKKISQNFGISHYLGTKGGSATKNLHFTYSKGVLTDNCAQVFGSDVKCTISKTDDAKNITYLLTISQNS